LLFAKEEKHQALAHPLCSREWSIRPQKNTKNVPICAPKRGQIWAKLEKIEI